MNSITHTITGLASSLLLNAGLTEIAQKLDPISEAKNFGKIGNGTVESCAFPCNFTPTKGE